MDLLDSKAFVWCIAGHHVGETLVDIVARKQVDITKFGWCLWAYGGGGNAHPKTEIRRLARDYLNGGTVPLLMPDTGKESPVGTAAFTGFRVDPKGPVTALPAGMSPVTGGARSWAFRLTQLRVVGARIDVGAYVAPFAKKGVTPLPAYLRVSRGRACAARQERGDQHDVRLVNIVGELAEPYAVFLTREGAPSSQERSG